MRTMKARTFTIPQFYSVIRSALRSMPIMRKAERLSLISKEFINHIMLVVTEVNGCALCNYYHAKHALESGMTEEELSSLVTLETGTMDEHESTGLLFAQHYADTFGAYDDEAWERVVSTYGKETAKAILATTRVIMFGNINGIAFGAILDRFKGRGERGRSILGDIVQSFGVIILLPAGLIHNIFS